MRKSHTTLRLKRGLFFALLTSRVPNALPGRDNSATDIHGMSGIPENAIFGIFLFALFCSSMACMTCRIQCEESA